jgi:hypothetical protein
LYTAYGCNYFFRDAKTDLTDNLEEMIWLKAGGLLQMVGLWSKGCKSAICLVGARARGTFIFGVQGRTFIAEAWFSWWASLGLQP